MRRLLVLSAVWTASVLSFAMVVGACGRARHVAPTRGAGDESAQPAVERFKEVMIPRGTALSLTLDDAVGSATSRVDEKVRAHLTRPVIVNGEPTVPAGAQISGAVVDATPSQRVKGRAQVAIRFDSLRDGSGTYPITTPAIVRTAAAQMKKDTMKVAIPAAAGAVIGGVLGGGKGAVIGGAVGGGAGAGYVMSQRGAEVVLRAGTALTVKLLEPLTVRVRDAQPTQQEVRLAN